MEKAASEAAKHECEMNEMRWKFLMSDKADSAEEAALTPQELKEGWHYCMEMDGLLANSNDPNGDCFCELNPHRNKPLTPS